MGLGKFSTIYWVRTKDHNQGLPYLDTLFLICSNNKFNGEDIDSNKCLTRLSQTLVEAPLKSCCFFAFSFVFHCHLDGRMNSVPLCF